MTVKAELHDTNTIAMRTMPQGSVPRDSGLCLHALFDAQSQRAPEAWAVSDGVSSLTYAELRVRANQVAHYLRRQGIGPESLVGLCADRSTAMIVGLLGILKAGAAYVPLDPDYPSARLKLVAQDAGLEWVVSRAESAAAWRDLVPHVLELDQAYTSVAHESTASPTFPMSDENLAYVIHTSGSTGSPKGVMVTHRSLVNLWRGLREKVYADLSGALNLSLNASLCFDASAQQWLGLLAGHALHLVPSAIRADGVALGAWIRQRRIDVLDCVPSQLKLLIGAGFLDQEGWLPRAILPGGEAIDPATWTTLVATERSVSYNMYGPAECTVDATSCELASAPVTPSIGRPLANQMAYILDENLDPVSAGDVGELYIGGLGVSRGYLNKPAMTAERFLPDPFSPRAGARMYKTGDMARCLPDGNIEYLGRRDSQVKIRGNRIELGEIESVLAQAPAVADCAVSVRSGRGSDVLIAHVVGDGSQELSSQRLRDHCAERLLDHMVPLRFFAIEALPLLPNGKRDRKALAAGGLGTELVGAVVEPRTETEARLAEIWRGLLDIPQVSVNDSLFQLGGDSLLATQLAARIVSILKVRVPVSAVLAASNIAELARDIETARHHGRRDKALRARARDGALAPVSCAQERLWFLDQLEGIGAAYNVPSAFRLEGDLDISALQHSLDEIVRRHEALRTVFVAQDGIPKQRVLPPHPVSLDRVDLSSFDESALEQAVVQHTQAMLCDHFDLEHGPLQHIALLRLAPTEHILLINTHHIASDGWSEGVFRRELGLLYSATVRIQPSPLEPLAVQYVDYAYWQRDLLRGGLLREQRAYWREQLAGVEHLRLPSDKPRPATRSFQGGVHRLVVPVALVDSLQALARSEGVTLFMVLLAGYLAHLRAITGQDDLAVGTPIAGRVRQELEDLMGFFVNTLALRAKVSPEQTFRQLLRQVRDTAQGAYAHQDIPFDWIVRDLQPQRDTSRNPLVQVILALQNASDDALRLEGIDATRLPLDAVTCRFDLECSIYMREDHVELETIFATDLFTPSTIESMAERYLDVLQVMVSDLDQPVGWVCPDWSAERVMPPADWNATSTSYPRDASVYELFRAVAAAHPDDVAVVCGDDSLTYDELDERAARLASYLRLDGVCPESLVGICIGRSLDMIVGLLGILGAGGAYAPLDPGLPPSRLAIMLADARPQLVLTHSSLVETHAFLAEEDVRLVCIDQIGQQMRPDVESPSCATNGDSLAYIMYTSGTTGRPKGVAIPQRGIVRLVQETDYCDMVGETFLHMAPLSFDASTFEIWGPLLNGGRLVVMEQTRPSLSDLGRAIAEHGVTTLWLTAGLFHIMVEEHLQDLGPLKQLLAGGDVLAAEDVQRVLARWPHIRMINGYGPTENTTFSACYTVQADAEHATVPIGRPIANSRAYILDEQLSPVPVGVVGELYVAGDGLARGYHNLPAMTAERFLPDPYAEAPGARMYKTGDLARYLPDGAIEFLGRRDNQIKLRGFRIELGEIEAVLRRHPAVRDAVVVAHAGAHGGKRLAAYVVCGPDEPLDKASLRAYLASEMPAYQVPSVLIPLRALPLTPNGKVDRRALPALSAAPDRTHVAPRNPRERAIADIWATLLGVDQVGVHDNFFELGGHSLLATQAVARIQKALQVDVAVNRIFSEPTVALLAAGIAAREIEPIPVGGDMADERVLTAPAVADQQPYVAPRTPRERAIADIWAALLGVERVGIHDNFFELGAHSLLATQAVARIEKALQVDLAVSHVFHEPTVASLVAGIAEREGDPIPDSQDPAGDCGPTAVQASSSLVPLRERGDNQPLFCIHPLGDDAVLAYRWLAAQFGGDHPIYGLQPRGLDGRHRLDCTIEDMAAHYVEQMTLVCPEGPYAIVGHSAGGLVAYEMARIAHRQNKRVNLLALIDTHAHLAPLNDRGLSKREAMARRLKLFRERMCKHWAAFCAQPWRQRASYLMERCRRMASDMRHGAVTPDISDPDEAMWYAINRYVPASYAGEMILLRAQEGLDAGGNDVTFGWSDLVEGSVRVYAVPGDHISIMREPNVTGVADILRTCLDGPFPGDERVKPIKVVE